MVDYITLTIGGAIGQVQLAALADALDAARFGPGRDVLAAAIADGRSLVLDGEPFEGDFVAVEIACREQGVRFHRTRGASSALLDAQGPDEYSCLDDDGDVTVDFKTFSDALDHSARAVFALRDRLARHASAPPPLVMAPAVV